MPSTYADWRTAFYAAAVGRPSLIARLHILEAENRVMGPHAAFIAALVARFDDNLTGGIVSGQAAIEALDDTIRAAATDPAFAFLLPMAAGSFASASTHVTGRYLSRFGTFGDIDDDAGAPPRLVANFTEAFAPPKSSIWLCPDDCSVAPDEMSKDLGLPHFEAQIAYRTELAVEDVDQFVPTCFDAGLFEAWQEPPPGHAGPCGLTRHVQSGERIHNEFVVETVRVSEQVIAFVRLPTAGPVSRVGALFPDYLVNR